jgi:hypothetical protein
MAHLIRMLLVTLTFSLTGCGMARMTLAQELAWDQWKQCDNFSGIQLKEIRQDGQIWVWNTSDLTPWRECIKKAREDQARRGVAAVPVAVTEAVQVSAARGPVMVPHWKVGDEWAFRFDGPSGLGTFVWEVDRIETLGGVPHYVIKTGSRRIYYRVDDLGLTREEVEGKIVREITPSTWRWATFPLTVGASWTAKYHEDRPVDRQSDEIERTCKAEAEEAIAVPAGTFQTFRIACRNARNDAWVTTIWYSPQVKHMVREESAVTGGKRVRELLTYRHR